MRKRLLWGVVLGLTLASGALRADERVAAGERGPWLGVYLIDEVDGGIRVVAVVPGGPAAQAGLRSGDLLLVAGDEELPDQHALERVLAVGSPGQPLRFEVLRDGEPLSVRVVPGTRGTVAVAPEPPPQGAPPPQPIRPLSGWIAGRLGLDVVAITPELRRHYGAAEDRGVLVVQAEAGTMGGEAGVEVGDVVVDVDGQPVTRPADLELAILRWSRRNPLKLSLVRHRRPLTVELAAPEPAPVAGPNGAARLTVDPRSRRRLLEASISRLEKQLEVLRRQLAELDEQPPTPAP